MHTVYALLKNKLSDVHPLHNIDLDRDVAYLKALVTKELQLQFDANELGEWPTTATDSNGAHCSHCAKSSAAHLQRSSIMAGCWRTRTPSAVRYSPMP